MPVQLPRSVDRPAMDSDGLQNVGGDPGKFALTALARGREQAPAISGDGWTICSWIVSACCRGERRSMFHCSAGDITLIAGGAAPGYALRVLPALRATARGAQVLASLTEWERRDQQRRAVTQ